MIKFLSDGREDFRGKRVAISGAGNVAQYPAPKAIELGAYIVSLSDSTGSVVTAGKADVREWDLQAIIDVKNQREQLRKLEGSHAHRFRHIEGQRPWRNIELVDIVPPCATQNELTGVEVEHLIYAGCRYVAKGSNMGCSQDAIRIFESHRKANVKGNGVWFAPGKAVNIGGSVVSGLEMAQNSQHTSWSAELVDDQLRKIMKSCFWDGLRTAEE